ncbi:hypothetical protein EGX24_17100 [Enterococcus gallinarum]|nr:hypothetical protein EGW90_17090 [Enterococcus gallinarum]ROZ31015.1 hypothetical protein EGX24_17100 [Enterococcus gallinarum]
MRRTERAAYRTKFYSNLSSPTRFDEEPLYFSSFFYIYIKISKSLKFSLSILYVVYYRKEVTILHEVLLLLLRFVHHH